MKDKQGKEWTTTWYWKVCYKHRKQLSEENHDQTQHTTSQLKSSFWRLKSHRQSLLSRNLRKKISICVTIKKWKPSVLHNLHSTQQSGENCFHIATRMDFMERDTVSGRFNRGEQGTTKGPDRTAINLQKDKEVKLKMCFPSYRTFCVDKGFKSERAYSRNEHNCTQPFAVVVIPL